MLDITVNVYIVHHSAIEPENIYLRKWISKMITDILHTILLFEIDIDADSFSVWWNIIFRFL